MSSSDLAVIILAAGKGTRMKSDTHKVLHPLAGHPMLMHLIDTLEPLNPKRRVIVVGAGKEQVEAAVGNVAEIVVQEPQLGTGHAVQVTRDALKGFDGNVLILYGDVPMLTEQTLQAMVEARRDASVVVLGFRPADTKAYGRLVVNDAGELEAIVEHKDASDEQRQINLCNSGIMAVDGRELFTLLDQVGNDNASQEYYLTDIVEIARSRGLICSVVEAHEDEVMGVNSRKELAEAEAVFQRRKRDQFMADGVTLIDPNTVFFAHDTRVGRDVVIGPNVFFGPGVTVEDRVKIHSFSHLEGATVHEGASIGPFARLRPAADIGEGAKIGNFVEVKKSTIEKGAKVSHLTYIGDARVGEGANIGAGTITCNYDGFNKFKTDIGAGAFIGSNTSLVAPVTIGEGAIVGAGSVVTREVSADALAVTRATQKELGGWALKFREKQKK
ncbi:bifunctional UDP-N-acetylglucosamine diphosphorylase/glucosamine-1-phosphate N-acetyltransferase GlmU [Emcibacter nanhaiensis]|uniref:Bifunctional protein GlmU n=1 Tax=Emcibacter nanhaiensis TaxID=1505037 RepID=A0A501PAB5_9PROT|nr:bifunctional UDP-N-acetylglucosamine diphosphorylase/glucosamine-1-phosphate N-acetyltransferase GlmU [Emcibacter nanhaiensis]TPD57310.1 bifunctional UDP-N-acetylglucosamine diphosphorylase/glucosamine-1-phosphate N-acetyltransferase GlmU [Emcibacter nanhaiensis]